MQKLFDAIIGSIVYKDLKVFKNVISVLDSENCNCKVNG